MKKIIIAVLFMVGAYGINAQSNRAEALNGVKEGSVLQIGTLDTPRYKHIDFPRPNFIIKKGGIANYKKLEGVKVVVTAVNKKNDGTLQVQIQRTDGKRFFGNQSVVNADLKDALESGELRKI
jgi:ABC-type enterochelin transport system substrate-binding protein